jgi:hypothetical protein
VVDAERWFVAGLLAVTGAAIAWVGRRIRAGEVGLVAGSRGTDPDDETLARTAGPATVAAGLVVVVAGVAYALLDPGPGRQLPFWGVVTVACLLPAVYVAAATRRAGG